MNMQSFGYISALFISLLGSSISMLALPWFLLEITGDVKCTAIILGARLLPVSISLFYGVRFIDRFSRKNLCVMSDLVSATLVFALPALYAVSMLDVGILVLLICALTAIEQINHAGLSAMVPDILKETSIPPERLNGIIGSLHNFGDLAGPPLAGIIIAFAGSTLALVLDGVTFLISSVILYVCITFVPAAPQPDESTSSLKGLKDSVAFIFRHPKTRYIVIPSIWVNFLIVPLLSLMLPYLAKMHFSSAVDLGLMISAFGGGALLSSLIFTTIGDRLSTSWLLITCTVTLMICFSFMVISGSIFVIMALLFFVGLSVGLMGPLDDTILQASAPEHLRGRVFLVYAFLRFATIPLAMVLFGYLLAATTIQNTFLFMAASLAVALVWLLANFKAFFSVH